MRIALDDDGRLRAGSPWLELSLAVNWRQRHELLRLEVPLAWPAVRWATDTSGGVIERPAEPQTNRERSRWEVAAIGWLALTQTVLFYRATFWGIAHAGAGLSAVLANTDPLFDEYRNLKDAPPHFLREVEHFFATYKQLEGVEIETQGWQSSKAAIAEIKRSAEQFNDS